MLKNFLRFFLLGWLTLSPWKVSRTKVSFEKLWKASFVCFLSITKGQRPQAFSFPLLLWTTINHFLTENCTDITGYTIVSTLSKLIELKIVICEKYHGNSTYNIAKSRDCVNNRPIYMWYRDMHTFSVILEIDIHFSEAIIH